MLGSHFQAQASHVQKDGYELMKTIWANFSKSQLCKDPQEDMSKGMKNASVTELECSLNGRSCKKDGKVNGKDTGKSSALNF